MHVHITMQRGGWSRGELPAATEDAIEDRYRQLATEAIREMHPTAEIAIVDGDYYRVYIQDPTIPNVDDRQRIAYEIHERINEIANRPFNEWADDLMGVTCNYRGKDWEYKPPCSKPAVAKWLGALNVMLYYCDEHFESECKRMPNLRHLATRID